MSPGTSPKILGSSWGSMEVDGLGEGKDFKLWPGGGRPWDWGETGTEHEPGIQPEDVAELLDHGAEIIVLSRGRQHRLQTSPSTLDELARHGLEVRREETGAAIDIYNALARQGRRVGGLFHSTC